MTLCDPMDCGPPGFSVRGIFPGKNTSGLPVPRSVDFPDRGIELVSPALAGRFSTTQPPTYSFSDYFPL